jgi:hypothetical protein
MSRRLKRILPPYGWIVVFVAVFLIAAAPEAYVTWRVGPVLAGDFPRFAAGVLVGAALAYGVYRVVAFHPFCRPEYAKWLESTPWTIRKALPLGPVHLIFEDALPLCVLTGLALTQRDLSPFHVAAVALLGYLVPLAVSFAHTGEPAWAYMSAFGLGFVIRVSPDPIAAFVSAVALALLAQIGLSRSLARFPWPHKPPLIHIPNSNNPSGDARPDRAPATPGCGWPFDQLRPNPPSQRRIDVRDAILVGTLVGWLIFALESLMPDPRARHGILITIFSQSLVAIPAVRIWRYLGYTYRAPIQFWGRIATFRWIIPRFDQVFVTPLCAFFSQIAMAYALHLRGLGPEVFVPVAIATGLIITLGGGPSLERWRLTGKHRIQPSVQTLKTSGHIKVG